MRAFWQDIRFGFRIFVRNPELSIAVVLVLALGIGGSTAVFTVVNGVLLQPLPYPRPGQILQLWQISGDGRQRPTSDPTFEEWRAQSGSFQAMAQYNGKTASVTGGREPVRAQVAVVSRDFFGVFGVTPALGRVPVEEEHQHGGQPVAVVSYGFWQRFLGGDTDLRTMQLTFDDRVFAVVGVMPPHFGFPGRVELWVPRELYPRRLHRTAHNWRVVARLKNSVTLEQAKVEMTTIARRQKQQYGEDIWLIDVALIPLREQLVRHARPALLVLLGAVGLLLLVSCANVMNLLLAHVAARQKEFGVRAALGAGRWRLMRQSVTENLLLALAGGAAGMLLASLGTKALLLYEPGKLPRSEEITVDTSVLLFTFVISVLIAVLLGLSGTVRISGTRVHDWLKQGSRTQAGTGGSGRTHNALVVSQVSLAVVLLAGATLLGRSFLLILKTDLGFRTDEVMVMSLSHPDPEDKQAGVRLARFHEQLIERLRAIPGVTGVGGVDIFPLSGASSSGSFLVMRPGDKVTSFEEFARLARNKDQVGQAEFRVASADYFNVMDISLIRGRMFDERDGPDAPHVALISKSLAEQRWPNKDPIGKSIQFGNMDGDLRLFTVIGIVGDIRHHGQGAKPQPTFYGCCRQRPMGISGFSIALRSTADLAELVPAARRMLRELDPEAPARFRTVEGMLNDSLADRRFNLLLLTSFGATALLLALMGIYGVVSYSVRRRTQEIGVRMALGARPHDVLRMIMGHGAMLTLCGVAAGLLIALVSGRVLRSMLFGIAPTDPITFVGLSPVVVAAALAACYIPARRAAQIDPMATLRSE